jgi:hypothetical protein
MSGASQRSVGWTLEEAIKRTVDPDILADRDRAAKVWRDAGAPRRFMLNSGVSVRPEAEYAFARSQQDRRLYDAYIAADGQVIHEFRCHLAEQRLITWGRPNNVLAAPTLIPATAWKVLLFKDLSASIVTQPTTPKMRIFDVRVFPTVEAPDAAAHLANRALVDACLSFVFGDPEVRSLAKRLLKTEPAHAATFQDGQYPGLYVEYAWPVDINASDLAWQFVKPGIFDVSARLPEASDAVNNVSRVLVDRWRALRAILVGGQILARGTFVKTGTVSVIDPPQWARQKLWVDVRSGDLLEEKDDKLVPRWTGLMLTAGATHLSPALMIPEDAGGEKSQPTEDEPGFHVKPLKPDRLRSPTTSPMPVKETPQRASIAAAIAAIWPQGIPAGLAPKTRDQRIIGWQKESGLAKVSSKTIRRYLSIQRAT